jgi:hypothetical protein
MFQKKTLKASVGSFWIVVRTFALVGMIASIPLYLTLGVAGFATLFVSSLLAIVLNTREYVIASFQRIQTMTVLRERLITFGDHEFILRDLAAEQTWHGEPVNQEIIDRLAAIEARDKDMFEKIMKMARDFVEPPAVTGKDSN